MKAHSVKSNAKRAARKLAEQFPGLVAVEPLATKEGGPWHALVAAAEGFDPSTLPAGTFAEVEFIAADGRIGAPFPKSAAEPVPPALRATPAGKVALAEQAEAAKLMSADDADLPASLMLKTPEPDTANMPAPLAGYLTSAPADVGGVVMKSPDAGRSTAMLDIRKVAASIPPTKSTPEEVAARREARRNRPPAEPKPARVNMATVLVELASRPQGATNEEMQAATGWQAHTLRGYIAGTLRKRGHAFELRKAEDGRKAYHC